MSDKLNQMIVDALRFGTGFYGTPFHGVFKTVAAELSPMLPLTNYRLILPDGSIVDRQLPEGFHSGDSLDIDKGQFTVMMSEFVDGKHKLFLKRQS